jgi:hypothetical protein
MFNKFFGKRVPEVPKPPEAQDSRGLEVVEDDPETSWNLWDSALAAQDSRMQGIHPPTKPAPLEQRSELGGLYPVGYMPDFGELPTRPIGLDERSPEQLAAEALERVELHHHRIAQTIRTLWGYKECSAYINQLIMSGGDGMGHARIGFKPEAVEAMLVLVDLHDLLFGPAEPSEYSGFSSSVHSGLSHLR